MGFWSSINDAIFGAPAEAAEVPAAKAAPAAPSPAKVAPAPTATATTPAPTATATTPATAPPAAAAPAVDVAALLDAAAAKSGQKLDWRKSIVDLLKALGIDNSLSARKELAAELGYTGNTADSAAMNIWLHKQVIQKLKDNGGTVPAELLD